MLNIPNNSLINKYAGKKGSFYSYYPMNGLWDEKFGKNSTKRREHMR